MPDIFLSYSRDDQPTARLFADAFKREGLSVWWDQTLAAGEAYDEVTERALREAKAVVVLWSKTSVASRWVRAEATIADRAGTLVPAMIEDCTRPVMFELRQSADLSKWRGEARDPVWQAFVADVRKFVDRQAATGVFQQPQAPVSAPAPAQPPAAGRRRPVVVALAAVALLAVAGAAWLLLRGAAAPVTLAVLPFVNIPEDPGQESFSDGLTGELINVLEQVRGLKVTGSTSSFSFKGKKEDLRIIAGKLGVANLLEGSVRRDGKRVRITVQLIDGKSGTSLWSKPYDEELQPQAMLALQIKVAADVAAALRVKLDLGEIRREEGGTTDVEAWGLALQAIHLLRQNTQGAREDAVVRASEAVQRDGEFSLGWYRLAQALPRGSMEQEAAFARIKKLTPNAWWALQPQWNGVMRGGQRQWAEMEKVSKAMLGESLIRSVDMDRTSPWFIFLADTGRVDDALILIRQVAQLEPQSLMISGVLQEMLDDEGWDVQAQKEYRRSLTLSGDHFRLHLSQLVRLLQPPRVDAAAIQAQFSTLLNKLDSSSPPAKFLRDLASVYTDPAAAKEMIRKESKSNLGSSYTAMLADAYDDRDLALQALRSKVIDELSDDRYVRLLWYPFRSGVRSDPRFKKIVKDLGLVDFWRKSDNWGDFCKPVGNNDFECH